MACAFVLSLTPHLILQSKANLKDVSAGANKSEANRDGELAAEHLRTLGKVRDE